MPPWPGMLPATLAGALLFGMTLALPGGIQSLLAKRLGVDLDRVGGLLALFHLVLIPFVLLGGVLVSPFGAPTVLLLGSLLTALGIFALAMSRSYRAARYAILLTGAGGACLNVAAVVLMPKVLFEGNESASLNLGSAFFGLGALLTPAWIGALARFLDLRRTLTLLAAACLVPGLLAIWFGGPMLSPPDAQADLMDAITNPVVWLATLAFLLYGPLEGALGTWTNRYLAEPGFRQRRAAFWLAGFWLTFLGARLLTAWLQEREVLSRGSDPWFILALALLAAVVFGNLSGGSPQGFSGLGLLVVGALLGPIFPTLIGLLFKHVLPGDRGTAYGILYALGATAGLWLPPWIGAVARKKTVRGTLRLHTGLALLLAAAALLLALQ